MGDRYLASLLGNGERVILETRQHWFVLLRNVLVEGVAIIAIAVLFTTLLITNKDQTWSPWLAAGFLLLIPALISGLVDFFQWFNRKYIVTTWRVIQLSGVINKDVIDSSLEKVNDVKLTQSFFGRIFNFGTVEILTASELGVNMFKTLGSPIRFKTTIVNAKGQLDSDEGFHASHPAAQPVVQGTDVPALLSQLDNLRKQGILSEEEFQVKKQELLAKM